ncbi:MAG: nucleoside triphosphate pyrophosphohydrolase [Alcanivoracaceae bacterium]|nr:nucleoside triphosphate pyrophosphohydrolase [Alcanivoracaceae bacterium]
MSDDHPIHALIEIMARLRDPDGGCQWDLQQTFDTVAPYTVEEAFEVAQAIAERDYPELREELGDLLLQVIFHSQMASEQGLFDFSDVVRTLNDKMVRRHPHVFGDQQGADIGAIKQTWERIKAEERVHKGRAYDSALDGVPAGMPALQRAAKLQKKAARVGFDWPETAPVLDQVRSEVDELAQAMAAQDRAAVEDELGDVLFTVVNLSRHLKVDPELALRRASAKFRQRFGHMEALARADDTALDTLDADQLEALWRAAKAQERR